MKLIKVPRNRFPTFSRSDPVDKRLKSIQNYINEFQYNFTGKLYTRPSKKGGLKHISALAKDIIAKSLPIQCIEATFLGVYLTNDMVDIERFPLFFKSGVNGHIYKHIVLGVKAGEMVYK